MTNCIPDTKYDHELLYEYTDNRGLFIPPHRIHELLSVVGKTEDEIINFLGRDLMKIDGCALYFIEMLANQIEFFINKGWYKSTQEKKKKS